MKKLIYFASFLLFFTSCSIDSEYEEFKGEITKIAAPDTLVLNQTAYVEVHFSGGTNGCAFASRLSTTREEEKVLVEAFYYYPKNQGICAEYLPTHVLGFNVLAEALGELIIRANDEGGVSDTILVVAK